MKFMKFRIVAFALIGCFGTMFLLNWKTPNEDLPAIQLSARQIDLSAYLSPMANYGSVKTQKIAPLIMLDDSSHFEPLQKMIQGRILLDFYATWCGPCMQQGRILEEIVATEELGTSVILKIDIDKHPDLAQQFNVVTIPKLVVLDHGSVLHEQSGMANRETVTSWLINKDDEQLAKVPNR